MDVREKLPSEKRLIDADKLLEIYKKWIPQISSKEDEGDRRGVETCIAVLEDMQTMDAVPVVRCRECKHRYTENCPMYFHASYWHEGYEEYVDDDTDHTEDDYFCQEGERKEGAD